ncbi:MAG: single-stranded-DNA-specific exonuclease RecJ [Pseudomonadota bacterium]
MPRVKIETRPSLVPPPTFVAHPVLARVLSHRGISAPQDVDLSLKRLLPPTDLPDIDRAAERLAQALEAQQRILIVGDFDADGATSVALCMRVLYDFGARQVDFIVPNRFDYGYGLSPEIVELALQRTPDVILTVDNGVSSVAGVAAANAAGVDVIVTDHHLPGMELPAALAVVNPNLQGATFGSRNLAGVGVAYYLLGRLRSLLRERGWFTASGIVEPNMAAYLDLVALGTVADVVPLDSNNRVLVQQGLARMRAGLCCDGIKALVEVGGRNLGKLSAQDLGFAVGPRLNAAGRLEDMTVGIQCLLAPDFQTARKYAVALDELNKTRRALEQDMVSDAEILLAEDALPADAAGLTVYHESFHQGVVGIVAGRVRERHYRPVIAFADAGDQNPDELKGSARSIPGLHIRDVLDGIASAHPGLLLKFGGHAMAAGLSIKRVHYPRFAVIFDKAVRAAVSEEALAARMITDGELNAGHLNLDTAQVLHNAGPWGNGFEEPSFHGDFELVSQRVVGGAHLRLVLKSEGTVIDGIAFRQAALPNMTTRVRVVYKLGINDYGQYPTPQLVVEYLEALP